MKIATLMLLTLFIAGCSAEVFPVPEEAVKACIEKGWEPSYRSALSDTTFSCKPQKK